MTTAQQAPAQAMSEEELSRATLALLDAPPAPPPPLLRKTGLLLASIAAFIAFNVVLFWLMDSSVASSDGLWRTIKFVLVIVLVLFIHETGHFLAMRLFGYRDTTMFFVPGFGAAVTGRRHGIAAWKEAVVLLAGPIPGIILSILIFLMLAFRNPEEESSTLVQVAVLSLFINGFNLLPVKPLDGGKLLDVLLFARRPRLAVAFQALAGAVIIAFVVWRGSAIVSAGGFRGATFVTLGYLIPLVIGVSMLMSLRYRYWEINAHNWLRAHAVPLADDFERMTEEQRHWLFASTRQLYAGPRSPAEMARHMERVFHDLTQRQAGPLSTALLLLLWAAALAVAIWLIGRPF